MHYLGPPVISFSLDNRDNFLIVASLLSAELRESAISRYTKTTGRLTRIYLDPMDLAVLCSWILRLIFVVMPV